MHWQAKYKQNTNDTKLSYCSLPYEMIWLIEFYKHNWFSDNSYENSLVNIRGRLKHS